MGMGKTAVAIGAIQMNPPPADWRRNRAYQSLRLRDHLCEWPWDRAAAPLSLWGPGARGGAGAAACTPCCAAAPSDPCPPAARHPLRCLQPPC